MGVRPERWRLGRALLLVAAAACSSDGDPPQPSGAVDAGAAAVDSGVFPPPEHPIERCDALLACAAEAAPDALAGFLDAYGGSGTCWDTDADNACHAQCRSLAFGLGEAHPEATACPHCFGDADCGGDTPACDLRVGRCVTCIEDTHCGGATPACDTERARCVACTADLHCDGDTPACDVAAFRCLACTEDRHCPNGSCNRISHQCEGCSQDADCGSGSSGCVEGACCSAHDCAPEQCGGFLDSCGRAFTCGGCDVGTCVDGRCARLGLACVPGRGGDCTPEERCAYDTTGQRGFVCVHDYEGFECVDMQEEFRCQSEDPVAGGFMNGYVCADGFCRAACVQSGNCESGQACHYPDEQGSYGYCR